MVLFAAPHIFPRQKYGNDFPLLLDSNLMLPQTLGKWLALVKRLLVEGCVFMLGWAVQLVKYKSTFFTNFDWQIWQTCTQEITAASSALFIFSVFAGISLSSATERMNKFSIFTQIYKSGKLIPDVWITIDNHDTYMCSS